MPFVSVFLIRSEGVHTLYAFTYKLLKMSTSRYGCGVGRQVERAGALTCGQEIKKALDVLRLVFVCLPEGESLSGTAALLQLAGIGSISQEAVFTRFQKCGEWL
jgi:hypothetical protein